MAKGVLDFAACDPKTWAAECAGGRGARGDGKELVGLANASAGGGGGTRDGADDGEAHVG